MPPDQLRAAETDTVVRLDPDHGSLHVGDLVDGLSVSIWFFGHEKDKPSAKIAVETKVSFPVIDAQTSSRVVFLIGSQG